MRGYVADRFPALATARLKGTKTCRYEITPDSHFIAAEHDGVWIVGGGSGHGFKHGPAMAERSSPPGTAAPRSRITSASTPASARRRSGAPGQTDRTMPALIFDLDGTLVDTVYAHVFAWQKALAGDRDGRRRWRIHRKIGMSGGLFTRAVGREIGHELTDEDADELQRIHDRLFRELLPPEERRPLPGAMELLAELRERGVPHGIATSGRRPDIDASLDALGIPDGMVVVERGDVARAKPEPDLFIECGGAWTLGRRVLRHRRRRVGPARGSPGGNAQHRAAQRRLRRGRAAGRRRVSCVPGRGGVHKVAR